MTVCIVCNYTFVSGAVSVSVHLGARLAVRVALFPAVLSQSLHDVAVHERRPSLARHFPADYWL